MNNLIETHNFLRVKHTGRGSVIIMHCSGGEILINIVQWNGLPVEDYGILVVAIHWGCLQWWEGPECDLPLDLSDLWLLEERGTSGKHGGINRFSTMLLWRPEWCVCVRVCVYWRGTMVNGEEEALKNMEPTKRSYSWKVWGRRRCHLKWWEGKLPVYGR